MHLISLSLYGQLHAKLFLVLRLAYTGKQAIPLAIMVVLLVQGHAVIASYTQLVTIRLNFLRILYSLLIAAVAHFYSQNTSSLAIKELWHIRAKWLLCL